MKRHLTLVAALALAISTAGFALAKQTGTPGTPDGVNEQQAYEAHSPQDGVLDSPTEEHAAHGHDHGVDGAAPGFIAGSSANMEVVGQWTPPHTANHPERITDVWSLGDHAYLGTFNTPCENTGVYIVDISNPSRPHSRGFVSSRPGSRVNDVKVFSFDGLASGFSGDILFHSNEFCSTHPQRVGGVSLYDVTKPAKAKKLAEGVGDTNGGELPRARQIHNIYAWQDGDQAFVAIVDDEELLDVDILDITDPRNPVHVGETGLPDWPTVNVDGFGDNAFVHDIWAREVDGEWQLLLSYWDAGFIRLDVSDPTSPALIDPPADSDYPNPDPLVLSNLGKSLQPEGNGHAAAWNNAGDLILAGDEDFSPYRQSFEVTTGTIAGTYPAGEFGFTKPVASFPGAEVNGPTIYGGRGCPGDAVPDSSLLAAGPGEEKVVVFTRGTCFFSDKIHAGELAGYDVVIIGNHHIGAGGGSAPDAFICGSQGSPVDGTAAGLCIGHKLMHELFGDAVEFAPASPDDSPDMHDRIGAVGERIRAVSDFDGWGPFHLIDEDSHEELDAWAPSQVYDEDFAQGHGDLTMHNVEPLGDDLVAIAWYALGMRILDISDCDERGGNGNSDDQDDPGCITEAGHYIDDAGSNFWGVHVTENDLILGSDRNSGLWIFEHTG